MEITNDIKIKIFAQYLGQKVRLDALREKPLVGVNKNSLEFDIGFITLPYDCKLILKSLNSISVDDAIGVAKMLNEKQFPEYCDEKEGRRILEQWLSIRSYLNAKESIQIYQYLISKGYDMPQYLLGYKTLQESGLAIYE